MCLGSSTIRRAGSSGRQLGGSKTCSSGRRTRYPISELLLEAEAAPVVDVGPVARYALEARRGVEPDRLGLEVACLEAQSRVAQLARGVLERGQERTADPVAPRLGRDVHPPQLADAVVVAADAAAADGTAGARGDEEGTVGRLEIARGRLRAEAPDAVVAAEELRLERVGQRSRDDASVSLAPELHGG